MKQIHGHEVLQMMEGKTYSEASLIEAIGKKFGADALFHTCSAEGMTAGELVAFLKTKGKFMPAEGGFTVDTTQVCNK